jgi:hypothetical protein
MLSLTSAKIDKMRCNYRLYARCYKWQLTFSHDGKYVAHLYNERSEFMFAMFAPNYVALNELLLGYEKLAKLNNPTEFSI